MADLPSDSTAPRPVTGDGPEAGQLDHMAFFEEQIASAASSEAGPQDNEFDSGLEDEQDSTKSITSSIYRYENLHDRTYHSDQFSSTYWAPNDRPQGDVMEVCHDLFCEVFNGRLFYAQFPKNTQKILDIGTGTGTWAIKVGETQPQSVVIGIDMSPIQPEYVPPNVQIDDLNEPWAFSDNSLDYVHMRFLAGSVRDWKFTMKEAYRCLRPGGVLGSSEPSFVIESDDGTIDERSAWNQWPRIFDEYGKQTGQTFTVVQLGIQKDAIEEAGFNDVEEFSCKIPIGSWPEDMKQRQLGQYAQAVMETDALGFIMRPATSIGWTMEQIENYSASLQAEMTSETTHPWYFFKTVWGCKIPTSSASA
ncbi:S-adenosyl-L-methionine-dependent methyltransferase [Colletotrichum falcatum]|nr:S-adenosyl-L-methionine-dependent methyltransferase [Colletotrichum falcatum]